jgi:hypothetical protein
MTENRPESLPEKQLITLVDVQKRLQVVSYGFPLAVLSLSHGFPWPFLWISYVFPKPFPWLSPAFPITFLWFSYRLPMAFQKVPVLRGITYPCGVGSALSPHCSFLLFLYLTFHARRWAEPALSESEAEGPMAGQKRQTSSSRPNRNAGVEMTTPMNYL